MLDDEAGAFGLAAAGARVRIGRYEVRRRLAVGGMAELFLARSLGIEGFRKDVVIKRMLPQYANHPLMVEMFLDEARIAGRLHHPNIAQVFDIGEEGGEYFFTMEYIHGEDIGSLMRQCYRAGVQVPIEHAVGIGIAAAAGLDHAHNLPDDKGQSLHVVHRDVSPSNLMIGYDGTVKLVDFGIAKARERVHVTSEGGIKGKFAYMSPEQHRGDELDRRSDIFSLGIVLYEMATGTQLFAAPSPAESRALIDRGDYTPPSELRGDFPPELERIIMCALCYAPDDRYASAGEMLLDLEAFARQERLAVSTMGLGSFMRRQFAADLSDDEKTLYEARSKEVSLQIGGLLASGVRRTEAGTPPPLPTDYPVGTFTPAAPLVPHAALGTILPETLILESPLIETLPPVAASYPMVPSTSLVPRRGHQRGVGGFSGLLLGLVIGLAVAGLVALQQGWLDGEESKEASSASLVESVDAGSRATRPAFEDLDASLPGNAGRAEGGAEVGAATAHAALLPPDAGALPDAGAPPDAGVLNKATATNKRGSGKHQRGNGKRGSGKRGNKTSGKNDGKDWNLDSPMPPGSH